MPQITMEDLHPIVADRLNVPPDQLKGEFYTALAEWFGRVTKNI